MKMCVGGEWVTTSAELEVLNPYDHSVLDTVPVATESEAGLALTRAEDGAKAMRALSAYDRYEMLQRAAGLMAVRAKELAETITREEGKSLRESAAEVERSVQTLTLSAEEAKRLYGETVPLDAAKGGAGRVGFTLRVPCGIVVAISPFNFPLNLVVHKVGPAIAAGNAIIIKPASDTPLSALKLAEILLEAGVPPPALSCLTGSGSTLGKALCEDPRVRKISFTGSRDVGESICRSAGLKKVTMELGSNSPLIVMRDADPEKVAGAIARTGYANAGQVCISTQRVLVDRAAYEDILAATAEKVEALSVGDPMDKGTDVGPLIREDDAVRIEHWVHEAVDGGARIVSGGQRNGAVYVPTVVADVDPEMRISREELFGPAVAVTSFSSVDEALRLANASAFGLAAGVFTEHLDTAMRFARELESGNIHINWGPQWRADLMPYGGLKQSGFGKEGPRYAIEEMTEVKMVVIHPA